jgi:hypothetical protein
MTIQISPSEWEALSAFLDNQLADRDRTRLEARLKSEPELHRALEELRRTRLILRSQPRLKAPRNFTLTPAVAASVRGPAGKRGRILGGFASPFNTLRLASALATIFLVLITVGDLAVRRFAPPPATVAMSQEVAVEGRGMGGGGGGGPAIAPMAAPTEAPAVMEAQPAAPALASEIPDQKAIEVTPLSSPGAETAIAAKQPGASMDGPPPSVANGQPSDTGQTVAVQQPAPPPPASTLIRVLQVLLVLLAVGAGVGALMLRRNAA